MSSVHAMYECTRNYLPHMCSKRPPKLTKQFLLLLLRLVKFSRKYVHNAHMTYLYVVIVFIVIYFNNFTDLFL